MQMNKELYDKLLESTILMVYKKGCADKIAKYEDEMKHNQAIIDRYLHNIHEKPNNYGLKKGWGIAFIIIGPIMGIDTFMPAISTGSTILLCISFMFFSIFLIGAIMLLSARKMRLKHIKDAEKEYKEVQSRLLSENKKIKVKKEELAVEFQKNWKLASECYDFLPSKYQELSPVLFMLDAVKTLRADTLKEAINLWEAELKWIAEQQQKRQYEEIRRRQNAQMMAALSSIESNQEQLNSNLKDIKVMQYIDYFNKQ